MESKPGTIEGLDELKRQRREQVALWGKTKDQKYFQAAARLQDQIEAKANRAYRERVVRRQTYTQNPFVGPMQYKPKP